MSDKLKAPRGTFDALPESQPVRQRIEDAARAILERAGYGRIETPAFEDTELFSRGVGESTDIVQKQMFSFSDQGDRALTLRPEGTAPICRAYVEHGMHTLPQPVKLWYSGPFFRHERPQAGRYRQFFQVGAEAIGSDSPLVDAELIVLLHDLLAELGVEGVRLRLGSLGSHGDAGPPTWTSCASSCAATSPISRRRSGSGSTPTRSAPSTPTTRGRARRWPMRRRSSTASIPRTPSTSRRSGSCSTTAVSPTTLTRPSFAASTTTRGRCSSSNPSASAPNRDWAAAAATTGWSSSSADRPTPAAGWAAGIERIALALGEQPSEAADGVFVVADDASREQALTLVTQLRRAGVAADLDLAGRATKGQMKQADRTGAKQALILEQGKPAQLRDMESGEQREIDPARAVQELSES